LHNPVKTAREAMRNVVPYWLGRWFALGQDVMLRVRDAALNAAALSLLVGVMSFINRDAGRYLADVVSGDSMGAVAKVSSHIEPVRLAAFQMFGGSENEAMLAFGVVAVVLVASMFRS
jgi:hypothetical protein